MSTKKITLFDLILMLFMVLFMVIMIYPLLNVLALSLSDPQEISMGLVTWYPRGFNLKGYQTILKNPQLFIAYKNTIIYAFLGTVLHLLLTSLLAYALSIKDFVFKKAITLFLAITMFFNGGLIPTYLVIRDLHMIDTLWVMIVPGAVSAYTVIVFRSFFQEMPAELRESAYLDGAGDLAILLKIILPLSKALLATFALFSLVGFWNGWFNALLYLNNENKFPIQMLLRKIVIQNQVSGAKDFEILYNSKQLNPINIQMAVVVIAMAPILCAYPFAQKYFVKGVMIGTIKG